MRFSRRLCFVVFFVSVGLIRDCKTNKQSNYWPNGVVPYVLDAKFPSNIRSAILTAMREIEKSVNTGGASCVRFVESTKKSNILKVFHAPGCKHSRGYSTVPGGLNYMIVGADCAKNYFLLHTLHQVLGFYHEENRPDRDQHITVDYTNLSPGSDPLLRKVSDMDTFGLAYDYGSISHSGPYHYAKNKRFPQIKPSHSVGDDVVLGQREKLSPKDVLKVQKAYKCKEDTSYVVSHSRDYLVNCHFGKDMCNLKAGPYSQVNWVVKSGSVENGPYAGHSTGIDSYLLVTDDQKHKSKVATLVSPFTKGGPFCIEFYLYEKGPTSYTDLMVSNEGIQGIPLRSFRNENHDNWRRITAGVNAPMSIKVQVTLRAHIDSGPIALDDFKIYHGKCVNGDNY